MAGMEDLDLSSLLQAISQPGGEQIAALLDQLGIPAPGGMGGRMGAGLGSLMPSENPATVAGVEQKMSGPAPAPAPVVPDMIKVSGAPEMAPQQAPGEPGNPTEAGQEKNKLSVADAASLVKAVAPTQNPPLMHGGVTGGVKAPDNKLQLTQNNPTLGALMQILQGAKGPGGLGSYMR